MPLTAAGTPQMRWGEVQTLVLGLMRQTDSHLYAELSRARYVLSVADVHLIYLAVGWMNAHREKGSKPIEPPELYMTDDGEITVTDDDRAHAERLLLEMTAMPD